MSTTYVNGHKVETGCYIDGHWGQYGPDRLATIAEEFGWTPSGTESERWVNDPRELRARATKADQECLHLQIGPSNHNYWELHIEATNDIEQWLNDHTAAICTDCNQPVEWVPSGWWRHISQSCEFRMMDTAQQFIWYWHDGEFFLSTICNDPDTCTDRTCAHWCWS